MSRPQDVQKLVRDVHERLQARRVSVAVVGDMILDTAIEGVPGGRHPETLVPTLREATAHESIGGAANIALTLARLGADVALFGIIGSDLPGRQLENLLDRQPFADYLITERGWPTPRKDWIYEKRGTETALTLRIDYDRPLGGGAREELVGEFRGHCPAKVDVVILADHGLGSIGAESLALIGLARERGARIVAIPRTPILRGQSLDAIVINSPEMKQLARSDDDPRVLAARYAAEYSQDVFLPMLAEGIFVCPAGTRSAGTLIEAYPLDSADWMGTRDMGTAILSLGAALGLDPLENARLATPFRHLVAAQRGNGRVVWRDVFRLVGLEAV
ncbi:MAG TPA: PfkB family carbohydrate kinase [Gemmataceae bacterium]|nr:PfkB family carbohydrate kinase [Gemmataceae bacterium]